MIFNSVCIYVTVDMFVQHVEDAIHAMDTGRHRDRAKSTQKNDLTSDAVYVTKIFGLLATPCDVMTTLRRMAVPPNPSYRILTRCRMCIHIIRSFRMRFRAVNLPCRIGPLISCSVLDHEVLFVVLSWAQTPCSPRA